MSSRRPANQERFAPKPVVDPTAPPVWYQRMQEYLDELIAAGVPIVQQAEVTDDARFSVFAAPSSGDLRSRPSGVPPDESSDTAPRPKRFYSRMRLRGRYI